MAVFGGSVVAVAWLITSYLSHIQQTREMALNDERIKANIVKARVDSALRDLPDYAKRLSARLSDELSSPTTALSAAQLEHRIAGAIQQELADAHTRSGQSTVDLFQYGVGLDRDIHPDAPLFLLYARNRGDSASACSDSKASIECQDLSSSFCLCANRIAVGEDGTPGELDYTAPGRADYQWFHKAKAGQSDWVEPYFDVFTQAPLTEYTTPLRVDGRFVGAVYANYSSREMRRLLTQEDVGGVGYSAIVANDGTIVVHPVADHVRERKKLAQVDPALWRVVQKAFTGSPRCGDEYEETSAGPDDEGAAGDAKHRDVQATGTVIAYPLGEGATAASENGVPLALVVVFNADREIDVNFERRTMVQLIAAVILVCMALIGLLLLRTEAPSPRALWTGTTLVSALLLAGIGAIWALTELRTLVPENSRPVLVSKGRVTQEVLGACQSGAAKEGGQGERLELPSGVGRLCLAASDAPPTSPALANNADASDASGGAPSSSRAQCRVPTGLFIQSVEFPKDNADTVNVTGYVWQKYPLKETPVAVGDPVAPELDTLTEKASTPTLAPEPATSVGLALLEAAGRPPVPDVVQSTASVPLQGAPAVAPDIEQQACDADAVGRGFLFPEAVSLDTELAYEELDGKEVTVGWTFNATFRETFSYSKYPLDTKDVWLRLWHKDFSKNVVLVPDLAAYSDLRPSKLPGVEQDLVHTGWTLRHAFFDYECASYNTNFGIADYTGQASFPELRYHVVMQRTFFSAFVKNLVPLLVAAIILFSVLLLVTRQRTLSNRYGANTSGTMAACSGLFFTVLLAHIQLRSDFPVDGVLYLEWFNFTTYVMILAVAVNAYLYSWDSPFRWVAYRDNLISKLLFWPVFLWMLLLATAVSFYRHT